MFVVDDQTLNDLRIFQTTKGDKSIMSLFDAVESYGGRHMLGYLFRTPLSDIADIKNRMECIKYLESKRIALKVEAESLDFIEHYFSLAKIPSRYSFIDGLRKRWGLFLKDNNEYYIITRAVKWLAEIIKNLNLFAHSGDCNDYPILLKDIADKIIEITESPEISEILKHKGKRFSAYEIERFDHLLRYKRRDDIRELLNNIYLIDVFQSVIKTKNEYGFTFADLSETPAITVNGLYHPFVKNPVANDIYMDKSNLGFITGANMAGKSTFMKAFGISVYLSHMGFPVPAEKMTTSVFDGLFTTINVPDDLSLGYSHFYSEVKRIKYVAEKVGAGNKYVVIFDELFRGTNVKDAYEATVTIIELFAGIGDCFYLFSSHIIEAAEELVNRLPNIQFLSFRTALNNDVLSYTYQMYEGISNDRFGMYIIEKEGIRNLLKMKNGR